ncbi:MAG TPA: hypothetical protein VI039_12690 [Solirubrobacterales bacterium]
MSDVGTTKQKPEPHFPPPTFESVPEEGKVNGKLRVTKPNAETGEILVRGAVPVKEYRGDGQAPERPKRLPPEPVEPLGTVGWIRARWFDYRLALHKYKAAVRAGALAGEEFDQAEADYWAFFAHKLSREERSELAKGKTAAIVRPVEPVWEKGEVYELSGKQRARVEKTTRTLKGWRTEFVIEDFRSFFLKSTVGGSSAPKTDDEGFAAEPTASEIERARFDGAYTQTEAQAVPDGGEVLEDKLHRRLHEEQSMKNAMAQSKGRVLVTRHNLEQRLHDALKKHRRSTARYLERQLAQLEKKENGTA